MGLIAITVLIVFIGDGTTGIRTEASVAGVCSAIGHFTITLPESIIITNACQTILSIGACIMPYIA